MIDKINIKQSGVERPSFDALEDMYEYAHKLAEVVGNASEVEIDAKVRIPFCAGSDKKRIEDKVGHEVIETEPGFIMFDDPEVHRVLTASPLTNPNGDRGVSIAEAEAATSLPSFQGNTKIESFEELGMFKIQRFGRENQFNGCTNLKAITLPETLNLIEWASFANTGNSMTTPTLDLCSDQPIQILGAAFSNCKILRSVNLPNLTDSGTHNMFSDSNLEKVINLGKITTLYNSSGGRGGAFQECIRLELVILNHNITHIGWDAFNGCIKLNTVVIKSITPPSLGGNVFNNCPLSDGIYVPDASVEAYKSADGWSAYAIKIKGFSEAPSAMREEYGF